MPKQKKQKKKTFQRKQKLLEHPISKHDVASLLAEIADIVKDPNAGSDKIDWGTLELLKSPGYLNE